MTDNQPASVIDRRSPADQLPETIEYSKIVLAEGSDDKHFLIHLLPRIGLEDTMWVYQFGGKANLQRFLRTFRATPGFRENVKSLGIIRDADQAGIQSVFQSVSSDIQACKLTPPTSLSSRSTSSPAVSVFLWPDNKTDGELETLCLRAAETKVIYECVEPYIECISENDPANRNLDKARLYAYLASQADPSAQIGQAVRNGYFDPIEPAFDPIIAFLREL